MLQPRTGKECHQYQHNNGQQQCDNSATTDYSFAAIRRFVLTSRQVLGSRLPSVALLAPIVNHAGLRDDSGLDVYVQLFLENRIKADVTAFDYLATGNIQRAREPVSEKGLVALQLISTKDTNEIESALLYLPPSSIPPRQGCNVGIDVLVDDARV